MTPTDAAPEPAGHKWYRPTPWRLERCLYCNRLRISGVKECRRRKLPDPPAQGGRP